MTGLAIDSDWLTRAFLLSAGALARYHRHQVLHLRRIGQLLRRGRRVILIGNHALDIVDPLLFLAAVVARYGRFPSFIGHENGWFRVPLLRAVSERYQVIPSRNPAAAAEALERHGFLMLYPGSNSEAAMRVYRDEPYCLKWGGRLGFLRLALECDADVLFVAAVGNDELYYQSRLATPTAFLRWVNAGDGERYRGARLGFGLLGPHLLPGVFPLPVRLTHVVSQPLDLGDRAAARRDPEVLAALHLQIWEHCQNYLDAAVARCRRDTDLLDRVVRGGEQVLQQLGL
jgi:hypothetical protein